jgi:hypothetical protein
MKSFKRGRVVLQMLLQICALLLRATDEKLLTRESSTSDAASDLCAVTTCDG